MSEHPLQYLLILAIIVGGICLLARRDGPEDFADEATHYVEVWDDSRVVGRCYATVIRRTEDGRLHVLSARTGRWHDWPCSRCTVEDLQ